MKRAKALSGHESSENPRDKPAAPRPAARGSPSCDRADPDWRARQLAQAQALWSDGDWQAAQEAFHALPELDDDPQAMVMYASCLRQTGRHEEAGALLRKAAPRAGDQPLHAIEEIKLALDTGRSAEALSTAEAAAARFPKHAHLHMLLGRARVAEDATDRAIEAYQAAIRLGAGATARAELAKLSQGQATESEAGNALRGPHQALLRLREKRANWTPSRRVAEAQTAARAYPDHRPLTLHWAQELREAGAYDRAEEVLRPLASGRDDVAACIELAHVMAGRGNRPEALSYMDGVIDRHPEHARAFLVWYYMTVEVAGRKTATARAERRIRTLGKSRVPVRVIGEICSQLIMVGRHDRVLSLSEGVEGEDRDVALLQAAAARAALATGQVERARQHFAEAVLRLCDPVAARRFRPLLEDALFSSRQSPVLEILRRLQISEEAPGVDLDDPDVPAEEVRSQLEELARDGDFADCTSKQFMDIVFACHDAGLYDLIRKVVSKTDDYGFLDIQDIENLIHMLRIDETDNLVMGLIEENIHRTAGDSEANLYWRLYRAVHAGRADESILDAERAVSGNEAGRSLCYFLALSMDEILGMAADDACRTAAVSIAGRLPKLVKSLSVRSFVERERRITSLMRQALPRPRPCLVTLLIPLHRRDDIANVRRNLVRQTWRDLEVIVLPNGPGVTAEEVRAALGDLPFVRIYAAPGGRIGTLLNHGVAQASGAYVLRFDADDIYLDHYVTNMVSSLQNSRADLIYKNSTFVYIETIDHVVLIDRGPDLSMAAGGNGASQGYKASTLKRYGFPENVLRSEDIHLARRIARDGGKVISVDPFDFVVVRRSNKATHTWHAPDCHLYGDPLPYGPLDMIEHLSLPVHE